METVRAKSLDGLELEGLLRFVTLDRMRAVHEITSKPGTLAVDERSMVTELKSPSSDPLERPGGRACSRLAIREAPAVLVKSLPRTAGGLADVEALGTWIEARLDERDPLGRDFDHVDSASAILRRCRACAKQ